MAERFDRLTPGQSSEVLSLAQAATEADQVAPLSEQVMLSLDEDPEAGDQTGSRSASGHFLAYSGKRLIGYAHLEGSTDRDLDSGSATAELVVDPRDRRQGIGTELLGSVETAVARTSARGASGSGTAGSGTAGPGTAGPGTSEPQASTGRTVKVWSHGDLPSGRAFALRRGYTPVRELWQMRRSLRPDTTSLPAADLPEGFRARSFVVGQDEGAWLQVNARAFVEHEEQGQVTRHDLDRRLAEPWFDPHGFILIEDVRGPSPVLAASHWTKVVADGQPGEGEVYVVGVDPHYQGSGLGRAATVLGLNHLRDQGLTEATLYVDADNQAAVSTYARLGFTRSAVDIMYSRLVHLQQ
jgi:mycothiol synthase